MYEAVKMSGRLLDRLPHIVLALNVEHVRDEIESILIVLDFGVEGCQVETIGEVLLVYIAEVLVSAGVNKLESE